MNINFGFLDNVKMYCSGGFTGDAPGAHPPYGPTNFLKFMQFFAKFGKIICWRPLEGWHPLLRRILDPPLYCVLKMKFLVSAVQRLYSLNRQTDKETGRQTDIHTHRHTDRHTDLKEMP